MAAAECADSIRQLVAKSPPIRVANGGPVGITVIFVCNNHTLRLYFTARNKVVNQFTIQHTYIIFIIIIVFFF